jgi:hypothetical protein
VDGAFGPGTAPPFAPSRPAGLAGDRPAGPDHALDALCARSTSRPAEPAGRRSTAAG